MTAIEPEIVDAKDALIQDMRDVVINTIRKLGLNPLYFMEGEPMKNVTHIDCVSDDVIPKTIDGEPLELQNAPFISGPINVTTPYDPEYEQWEQMASKPLDSSSFVAQSYPLSESDENMMTAEIANLLYYALSNYSLIKEPPSIASSMF